MTPSRTASLQAASAEFTIAVETMRRALDDAYREEGARLPEADVDAADTIRAAQHQLESAINALDALQIDSFVDAATGG